MRQELRIERESKEKKSPRQNNKGFVQKRRKIKTKLRAAGLRFASGRFKKGFTYSVVGLNEGIVDGNNLDLGVLSSIAEDNAADTTETVDADLDSHFGGLWGLGERTGIYSIVMVFSLVWPERDKQVKAGDECEGVSEGKASLARGKGNE